VRDRRRHKNLSNDHKNEKTKLYKCVSLAFAVGRHNPNRINSFWDLSEPLSVKKGPEQVA